MPFRLKARWPAIVAGIFCIYSVLLLWNAYNSKEQLKVAADVRMIADSKRRAAALGDFAAHQRSTTEELAGLHELRTYLANKALGMSPLYGLDASLGVVEQRFREWIDRDKSVEGKAYTRIAWVGEGGEVLVDTGHDPATLPGPAGSAWPREQTSLTLDLANGVVVTSAPVVFKGEFSGTVITMGDIGQIYHSLIKIVAEGSYRETLVTRDGREIATPAATRAFTTKLAATLARLPPGQPTAVGTLSAASRGARSSDTIAVAAPVPGMPAILVITLSSDEIYGHLSSSLFLFSLSGFPVLLLLAAFRMDRLQGLARAAELDAARSDAQRHVLQGRNELLSEEIERREAIEAELQRHRDHLEELVSRRTAELNRLFHALPDSYFRMARDGTILEHRAGREADLFLASGGFVGRKMQDIVPPDVAQKVTQTLGDVANGAEHGIAEYEMGQGRQFYEARLLPLGEDQLLMVVRNVTERRAFEEVREANRCEAERLARVKSEFLANMSHEIRTPLNAVIGLAQIGTRDRAGRAMPENFQGILDAGRHLLSIVDDILDFSKLEAGKLSVERRPFRLSVAVDAVVGLVAGRMAAKGLTLPVALAADVPDWVEGDALRLKQVLLNLMSNAVKFTDRGQVALTVSAEADRVVFKVADTGIGMEASLLARLFQPFEQADGSMTRRFGGAGLGLAISHNLAALMGGEIQVESRPGHGSLFTLRLPLPQASAVQPSPVGASAVGPRLLGLRILAAEDNDVNRLVLQAQLESEGCQVVFAKNGLEALACVAQAEAGSNAFDAVLMDVQMPVMDGMEATRRLQDSDPTLPVIALTAHALPDERERCLAAGMVDHVTKPVDVDRLVACLLHHVIRPPRTAASSWMTI